MKMNILTFSCIMFGMAMIGFSMGMVLGIYLHAQSGSHGWAYLAVPTMGLGSAAATYGTLRARHLREIGGE